jgi:hypothetical protein
VTHDLARLGARGAEAHPVGHRIKPAFQQLEQNLARDTLPAIRFRVDSPELALEHSVGTADLLLLTQLHAVAGQARALLAMLPGRVTAPLDGAFVREALFSLEEELFAVPPALPALRS